VSSFSFGSDSVTAGATLVIVGVGSLIIASDGGYSFTPVKDWSGEVPDITYVTNTGATGTLSLSVTAVADAPTLNVSVGEGVADVVTVVKSAENISSLGDVGNGVINTGYTNAEIENRTFDFGSEFAHQTIVVSFDTNVFGSWDNDASRYTKDIYSIDVNGDRVDSFDYNYSTRGEGYQSSQSNTYTVTLDEFGKASVDFNVTSTAVEEYVDISNIKAELSYDSEVVKYPLTISATENDQDGSETISYEISSLPGGVSLLDSNGNIISPEDRGNYLLSENQIAGLTLSLNGEVAGFDVTVYASSKEDNGSTSDLVSTSISIAGTLGNENQTYFENVASNLDSNIAAFESTGSDKEVTSSSYDDNGDDTNIKGTSNDDSLFGYAGNDHIEGFNAQDVLVGGDGSDWLEGGEGVDTLYGDDNNDVTLGTSSDLLDGGMGDDTLYGGGGDDFLLGGGGEDTL
jgi:Ca2+-binding RTX toxin-like protein